jgi:hypothetical protein
MNKKIIDVFFVYIVKSSLFSKEKEGRIVESISYKAPELSMDGICLVDEVEVIERSADASRLLVTTVKSSP